MKKQEMLCFAADIHHKEKNIPIILFGRFCFDTIITIIFQAEHIFQWIVDMGATIAWKQQQLTNENLRDFNQLQFN